MLARTDLIAIASGDTNNVARLIAKRAQFGAPSAGPIKLSFYKKAAPGDWWDPSGVVSGAGNWVGDQYNQLASRAGQQFANGAQQEALGNLSKIWNEHPELQYGVYGAGLGGLLGLGSGLMGKKKRPLSSLLTGAALGAGVGAGGRFLYDYLKPREQATPVQEAQKYTDSANKVQGKLEGNAGQGGDPNKSLAENLRGASPSLDAKLDQLAPGNRPVAVEAVRKINQNLRMAQAVRNQQLKAEGKEPEPFVPVGSKKWNIGPDEAGQIPTRPFTGAGDILNTVYKGLTGGPEQPAKPPTAPTDPNQVKDREPDLPEVGAHPQSRSVMQNVASTFAGKRLYEAAKGGYQGFKYPWKGNASIFDPLKGDRISNLATRVKSMLAGASRAPLSGIPVIGSTLAGRFDPRLGDVWNYTNVGTEKAIDALKGGAEVSAQGQRMMDWSREGNRAKGFAQSASGEEGLKNLQKARADMPFTVNMRNWLWRTALPYTLATGAGAMDPAEKRQTRLERAGAWDPNTGLPSTEGASNFATQTVPNFWSNVGNSLLGTPGRLIKGIYNEPKAIPAPTPTGVETDTAVKNILTPGGSK